ncbi:hypothetical protein [Kribbella sp. NPDC004875]|uniref:hypothetical protein n=1 Tax=Kribbella sp. NPDC004875 TaxID=3364107 RepID=UPI003673AC2F
MASVLLVITPISWILLHQPQNDDADASVPIVTRTDDTYITPSTKAAVSTPTTRPTIPPTATPTATPTTTPTATPTDTPTGTPTDSASPTTVPSRTPSTTEPSSTPTSERSTVAPTTPGRTVNSPKPTPTKTTTTPPPPVDGGMRGTEQQLFDMIDDARVNNGCARLKQDPSLTTGARSTAGSRAASGDNLNSGSGSQAGAGGDNMTVQQAYNQIMKKQQSTVLNCGLTTLGVGVGSADHNTGLLCPLFCSTAARNAWVANFS